LEWARRQSIVRDMERRMAYNGVFAGEWMPHGPAGGATSSSSRHHQQHTVTTQYAHITRIELGENIHSNTLMKTVGNQLFRNT
jgi:hypothetical protein